MKLHRIRSVVFVMCCFLSGTMTSSMTMEQTTIWLTTGTDEVTTNNFSGTPAVTSTPEVSSLTSASTAIAFQNDSSALTTDTMNSTTTTATITTTTKTTTTSSTTDNNVTDTHTAEVTLSFSATTEPHLALTSTIAADAPSTTTTTTTAAPITTNSSPTTSTDKQTSYPDATSPIAEVTSHLTTAPSAITTTLESTSTTTASTTTTQRLTTAGGTETSSEMTSSVPKTTEGIDLTQSTVVSYAAPTESPTPDTGNNSTETIQTTPAHAEVTTTSEIFQFATSGQKATSTTLSLSSTTSTMHTSTSLSLVMTSSATTSTTGATEADSGLPAAAIAGIAVGSLVVICLIAVAIFFIRRHQARPRSPPEQLPDPLEMSVDERASTTTANDVECQPPQPPVRRVMTDNADPGYSTLQEVRQEDRAAVDDTEFPLYENVDRTHIYVELLESSRPVVETQSDTPLYDTLRTDC